MTPRTRLGLLQGLSFASLGAVFPYLALELRARDMSGIALLLALISAPLLRVGLGPLWGLASDRLGRARPVVLAAAALIVAGLIVTLPKLGAIVAVLGVVLLAAGHAGIAPLVDAASLRVVEHDPGQYAQIRRWGSLGFLLAVLIAGSLRDHLGLSPLLVGLFLAIGLLWAARGLSSAAPPQRPPRPEGLLAAISSPSPLLLLAASAVHFAGIALYDGFFAVHLDALGHGMIWTGIATVLGVSVEIGVFSIAGRLMARFGAPTLLLFAIALNIPRWLLTAWITSPWGLVAIQLAHGVAFGAFWVAAVALLTQQVPRKLTGGAQGLLAAAVGGLGAGIGNAIGSWVVESRPTPWLFWIASALGCCALALAIASVWTARSRRSELSR
ncbi:MAG: MFS transporter [Deltaproteobacteria bacterium]|nr:MAG: MFS transporter [Deltaproteobacteria bacterium]